VTAFRERRQQREVLGEGHQLAVAVGVALHQRAVAPGGAVEEVER
jgi:hypothetical protein